MTGFEYVVDLDELDAATCALERGQRHLRERLRTVDALVRRLESAWTGQAATAHLAAHREWDRRAEGMHDALVELRAAAATAHRDYAAAVRANTVMWDQLR